MNREFKIAFTLFGIALALSLAGLVLQVMNVLNR
jgi:hypothetical protein